ncbi:ribulokinase [Paenibacillus melissococcoides]|uniref:Ribulokinase n=1 Tax=Paenibacillus melissococcoides TaxID=2912268 RepID=A0ABM9FW39_9BACL|nr:MULTISPECIES: ribulokinase [Paenibacillus]MEB9895913.1 ribulokinase [Bacillus cereus]CAH8243381.1 ribulokinase [Paenibacillus melissococcoides]CAH8704347.1 ribulokinase [Paenibacillus melissococcoides]CAH8707616.1 ribulokinase [Paenibacillus melissococcoides]GIO80226.1 ribulokinase [Paenibacillus dendritiformis]
MEKYVVGIDFGTLSARTILVHAATGEIRSVAEMEYPHGVMEHTLPDGVTRLGPDWALQHPLDYIECASKTLAEIFATTGVEPQQIIGVGTDFTECTMLPVKSDGTPLCVLDAYKSHPHAYVKLWKHHAAAEEANRLNTIAKARGESFLDYYGGKLSSEWMFPKIWQILNEAPEIYEAADRFMELADWITLQLTGEEKRNSCTAGYKAIWHKQHGYPSKAFFKALDPRLEHVVDDKMSRTIFPVGTKAGAITEDSATWTGLAPGTAVAVGIGDAHSAVIGCGITTPDILLMVMGTSGCDMLVSEMAVKVPGISGLCEDGIVPGYYGYEAGQSCLGDHFSWFANHCVPERLEREARAANKKALELLNEKAAQIKPGASGLLALDWWNGNRSVLVDADLTGSMFGMTTATTAEEMYKALVEAVAFGKRMIIENFVRHGVPIRKIVATGGIAEKSPFIMQTFADIIGMPIHVAATQQGTAMGAAMLGAVAAGSQHGGYDSIQQAGQAMGGGIKKTYEPNGEHRDIYDQLYAQYVQLHDYFGRNEDSPIKRLKAIKLEVMRGNAAKP